MSFAFHEIVTFVVGTLCVWSTYTAYQTKKIIAAAKKVHGVVRTSDKAMLATSVFVLLANIAILTACPKLVFSTPGAVGILQVGLGALLFYLHELQAKNWNRFKRTFIAKS